MRLDASAVRAAARGRWLSAVFPRLAPELGPALAAGPSRHVACPVHGGRNGDAFRLLPDAEATGGAVCNSCGPRADGFALLRWLRAWTFPEALAAVADALNLAPGEAGAPARPLAAPAPTPTTPRATDARIRARCRALWRAADPGAPFVLAYLRARGAHLAELPPDLRGAPAVPYFLPGGRLLGAFPTMLALLWAGSGEVRGLHRTWLDPDRPAKLAARDPETGAPLPVKKVLSFAPGACSGAAVHLAEPGAGHLAACEGIESAACILAATGVPVWGAYAAGALARLDVPPDVSRLDLWPDGDPPGLVAARVLAERCRARGVAVALFSCAEGLLP